LASDHAQVAQRLLADLGRCGARCALVGGFAFSVRVKPRSTKDVDFSVAVASDGEAEQLIRALLQRGYRHGALLENIDVGRLATVRLFLPGSVSREPEADLLFATCGIEPEVVANATQLQIDSIGKVAVARVGHLIAMKCLSTSSWRSLIAASWTLHLRVCA
jgi:predicted nucleotidyltransferase